MSCNHQTKHDTFQLVLNIHSPIISLRKCQHTIYVYLCYNVYYALENTYVYTLMCTLVYTVCIFLCIQIHKLSVIMQ